MTKFQSRIFTLVFSLSSLAVSLLSPAHAAVPGPGGPGGGGSGSKSIFNLPKSPTTEFGTGADLPTQIINGFINPILTIFSFLAVLYIVLAGFKFVRSSGDPKGAEEARRRLIFAILGFVILILATAMTQLINRLVLNTNTI